MVGPKKQYFWPKINILGQKSIYSAKNQYTQRKPLHFEKMGAPVCQKLGLTLEKKVDQKLKLEKNVVYIKWSPKLIFLSD